MLRPTASACPSCQTLDASTPPHMEIALVLVAVAAVPLWLNIKATAAVVRDPLSERWQKAAQLSLVWLLPVLGAIVVLAVHRSSEAPSRKYREPPDPGDDFALSGRAAKGISEAVDGD